MALAGLVGVTACSARMRNRGSVVAQARWRNLPLKLRLATSCFCRAQPMVPQMFLDYFQPLRRQNSFASFGSDRREVSKNTIANSDTRLTLYMYVLKRYVEPFYTSPPRVLFRLFSL